MYFHTMHSPGKKISCIIIHMCAISILVITLQYSIILYLVVVLDMQSICCFPKLWSLVEVSEVPPDVGIINNALLVTLM